MPGSTTKEKRKPDALDAEAAGKKAQAQKDIVDNRIKKRKTEAGEPRTTVAAKRDEILKRLEEARKNAVTADVTSDCPTKRWKAMEAVVDNEAVRKELYALYCLRKGKKARPPEEWWEGARNVYIGTAAEEHVDAHMKKLGFTKLDSGRKGAAAEKSGKPRGRGFDGLWEKNGVIYITESKFNMARLEKDALIGAQLSPPWVNENISMLKDKDVKSKMEKQLTRNNKIPTIRLKTLPSGEIQASAVKVTDTGKISYDLPVELKTL